MSQGEDAVGTYEKWDFAEGTELEKEEQRKPKGGIGAREWLWGSRDMKLEGFSYSNQPFSEVIAKFRHLVPPSGHNLGKRVLSVENRGGATQEVVLGGSLLFVLFFKKIPIGGARKYPLGGKLFGAASPHFTPANAVHPSLVSRESCCAAVHASGPHLRALHGSHHREPPER